MEMSLPGDGCRASWRMSLDRSPLDRPSRHVEDDALARRVIGAFYRVYDTLGAGFLEAVYARALAVELRLGGLDVQVEVPLDVWYRGQHVGHYRADQVVERRLVLELKAARALHDGHCTQLVNCLKAARLASGVVLNFGPKPRFWRVIGLDESSN
jgi:GxxExxY protein